MIRKLDEISEKFFGKKYEHLDEKEKKIVNHLAKRTHVSRNIARDFFEQVTFGQRMADRLTAFAGSWLFIGIFLIILVAWVLLNSFILLKFNKAFDPYPYILLNLFLSMLAAIQAPIILMSQNREASRDRLRAEHDYEVNLKAELEIMALHEKIDEFMKRQWNEFILIQKQQLSLLNQLIEKESLNKKSINEFDP